jgi:hypothetical protein
MYGAIGFEERSELVRNETCTSRAASCIDWRSGGVDKIFRCLCKCIVEGGKRSSWATDVKIASWMPRFLSHSAYSSDILLCHVIRIEPFERIETSLTTWRLLKSNRIVELLRHLPFGFGEFECRGRTYFVLYFVHFSLQTNAGLVSYRNRSCPASYHFALFYVCVCMCVRINKYLAGWQNGNASN